MSEPDAVGLVSFLASRVVSPPNPPSPGWLGPAPFMSCERVLRIGRVSGRFMSAVLYLSQSHVRIDRLFCSLVCFCFVGIPSDSLMTIEELIRDEIEVAFDGSRVSLMSRAPVEHALSVRDVRYGSKADKQNSASTSARCQKQAPAKIIAACRCRSGAGVPRTIPCLLAMTSRKAPLPFLLLQRS
jgi:hypothetical protein